MLNVYTIKVGSLRTNCYIVNNIIIDPGDDAEKIIKFIEEKNLKPKGIFVTHWHFDHVRALEDIKEHFNIKELKEFDNFKVIETSGHSKDDISIVVEDNVFSGDCLFKNTVGRTDLPGSDKIKMKESLDKLIQLPDHFKVYPGHGPASTIGEERKHNPDLNLT
ncbi:MBL fold metallo-hydrolase [Patescibacteria group bacterium]